jgi:outer membrane protein TolC
VLQEGFVLQAAGQFDTTFLGDLSYEYTQTELTAKEKKSEQQRRDDLDERIEDAQENADLLQTSINEAGDAREVWVTGGDRDAVTFSDDYAQAQYDVLLELYNGSDPSEQPAIEQAMVNFFDAVITSSQEDLDEALDFIAEKTDVLARMGDVPEVTQSTDFNLNLAIDKQFRSGITITPYADLTASRIQYKDKGYLADDGGLEIPDAYTTTLGFDVVFPLARNRGKAATGAVERAAEIDYDASLDALAFAASSSALDTLLAYWDLVAAQRRLEIQLESLTVNQRILDLTQALIDGDELPRAELPRTQAAVAQDQAAVDAAERAVIEARIRLADAVGLEVGNGAIAPLAADDFPPLDSGATRFEIQSDALIAEALDQRMDLRSARKLESSGKVLVEAARINLRPIVDFSVGLSYNNLGEDNDVWDGLSESVSGSWAGPSGKVGLGLEVPFGNHFQKGLYQQQQASLASASISAADLERRIALGIALDAASVEQISEQVANFSRAAAAYREAVDVELERLRYGTVTVLDTLVTQQRSLLSELSLIDAQARYAQILAQLAFDTGRLVTQQDGAGAVEATAFTMLPRQ